MVVFSILWDILADTMLLELSRYALSQTVVVCLMANDLGNQPMETQAVKWQKHASCNYLPLSDDFRHISPSDDVFQTLLWGPEGLQAGTST